LASSVASMAHLSSTGDSAAHLADLKPSNAQSPTDKSFDYCKYQVMSQVESQFLEFPVMLDNFDLHLSRCLITAATTNPSSNLSNCHVLLETVSEFLESSLQSTKHEFVLENAHCRPLTTKLPEK
jgi:hypothetical protein